jgi:hypothetical protein
MASRHRKMKNCSRVVKFITTMLIGAALSSCSLSRENAFPNGKEDIPRNGADIKQSIVRLTQTGFSCREFPKDGRAHFFCSKPQSGYLFLSCPLVIDFEQDRDGLISNLISSQACVSFWFYNQQPWGVIVVLSGIPYLIGPNGASNVSNVDNCEWSQICCQ